MYVDTAIVATVLVLICQAVFRAVNCMDNEHVFCSFSCKKVGGNGPIIGVGRVCVCVRGLGMGCRLY